jgi:hypothetical protein
MTIDQLRALVEEAARDLVARTDRPHPVTVVLPLPEATRMVSLDVFPDDDAARHAVLSAFAADHMVPHNAPCFGLLAEATSAAGDDLLVAVYGARQRGSHVTAAVIDEEAGLGEFAPAEPLDPGAMPFVQPLQHAADLASAEDTDPPGSLPIIG